MSPGESRRPACAAPGDHQTRYYIKHKRNPRIVFAAPLRSSSAAQLNNTTPGGGERGHSRLVRWREVVTVPGCVGLVSSAASLGLGHDRFSSVSSPLSGEKRSWAERLSHVPQCSLSESRPPASSPPRPGERCATAAVWRGGGTARSDQDSHSLSLLLSRSLSFSLCFRSRFSKQNRKETKAGNKAWTHDTSLKRCDIGSLSSWHWVSHCIQVKHSVQKDVKWT